MTEIDRLELRYQRLLRFDRFLWVVYAFTALIPGYFLFVTSHGRIFHGFGVLAIASVAWFGWLIDSRLLAGRLKRESIPYCVTATFVLSRVLIAYAAMYLLRSRHLEVYESALPQSVYWTLVLDVIFATPIVYVLFFAGVYRSIYHISVHFLLKIQEMKNAEQGAPFYGG